MARVSKSRLREVLIEQGGVIAAVAAHFGVTRQTVYNWIAQYELDGIIDQARDAMFRVAEDNLLNAVLQGDIDTSKFVVLHMPSSRRRWSNRTDVVTADVSALAISEDIKQLMQENGITMSDVVKEFETLLREQLVQQPRIVEGKVAKRKAHK